MKNKYFFFFIVTCFVLFAGCTPAAPTGTSVAMTQSAPEQPPVPDTEQPPSPSPEPTVEVSEGFELVNAVYFREGSNILGDTVDSQGVNYYVWLIPNGTIVTAITPIVTSDGICEDFYEIATAWNGDSQTIERVVSRASGTYQIQGGIISLTWDKYGVSYMGAYTPDRITVDVNGSSETFVLVGSGSLSEAWFPDVCIYQQVAEIPDPYLDPAPPSFGAEIKLYNAVLLQNGRLVLSFDSEQDIPKGTYVARIDTKDGGRSFDCQQLPDYKRRLYCVGMPLKTGDMLGVSIYRVRYTDGLVPSELAETFFNQRATKLPELDFSRVSQVSAALGGKKVTSVGEAWSVVGMCVQLFLGEKDYPKSCQPFIALGLGFLSDGFEVPLFFDGGLVNNAGQFELIEEVWTDFEDPLVAFEVPLFFEDPLVAFEDPLVAFEVPLFFEDPLVAFEDPLIAHNSGSFTQVAAGANPWFTEGLLTGQFNISSRALGLACGKSLGATYDLMGGDYTNQVYTLALGQVFQELSDPCRGLVWQCDMTPGSGCFLSPGALGWTWGEDQKPSANVPGCEKGSDLFYCQDVTPAEAGLYVSGRACARDIGWRQAIHTHGQYADLLLYLSSVAPWVSSSEVGENCLEFLAEGMRSLYGISPLAIWGTNGTSITPYNAPYSVAMPIPGLASEPVLQGPTVSPGNSNSNGGGWSLILVTPTPGACGGLPLVCFIGYKGACVNGVWVCIPEN